MRLELMRDGVVVRVVRLGSDTVSLGRDPANTLVLTDPDVSAHHAVIVPGGAEGTRLKDLRSTNGTFHNDARVDGEVVLKDRDRVRLASACELRVRAEARAAQAEFALEDTTSGTLFRLDADETAIGSTPGSAIEVPGGPARAAVVTLGDKELWLSTGDPAAGGAEGSERRLVAGDTFEAAGHTFVVVPMHKAPPTLIERPERPACALFVDLTAPGGPLARLTDARTGVTHLVRAENRATLLYVLARRRRDDLARGLGEDAGWVEDDDVIVGVWGKSGTSKAASNYSVLVHRLRRELDDAGLPPQLIEKRRGALRVGVDEIELVDRPA